MGCHPPLRMIGEALRAAQAPGRPGLGAGAQTIAYHRHGLPASLLTDNGASFTAARVEVAAARPSSSWPAWGSPPVRPAPEHPQTCGKVDRFHQTRKRWLARRRAGALVVFDAGYASAQLTLAVSRIRPGSEDPGIGI
jgi:hypothetical protein